MIKLEVGYSYIPVKIPNVPFSFLEQVEEDRYQLYTGDDVDDFSLIGEVTAKNDQELTTKMHPIITLAQDILSHED